MKKIFYLFVFCLASFLCLDKASAEYCYYRSDETVYDNTAKVVYMVVDTNLKTGYLMRSYDTNLVSNIHGEKQFINDSWSIDDWNKSSGCYDEIYFQINSGSNKLKTTKMSGENIVKLSSYNFSPVLDCSYNYGNGINISDGSVSLNIKTNEDGAMLVTFDGKLAQSVKKYVSATNKNMEYYLGQEITYSGGTKMIFDKYYINLVNSEKTCPHLSIGIEGQIAPVSSKETGNSVFETEINENLIQGGEKIAKEYSKKFEHDNLEFPLTIKVQSYNNMKERICYEYNGKFDCEFINDYTKDITFTFKQSDTSPLYHEVAIYAKQLQYIFSYRDKSDPSTLKEPGLEIEYTGKIDNKHHWKITVIENGAAFEERLSELQPYFEALAEYKNINIDGILSLKIAGKDIPFRWFNNAESLETYNPNELEYLTMQKINDVAEYCNNYYSNSDVYRKQSTFENRMNECISFMRMIKEASNLGLIDNSTIDCEMFSEDLNNILIKILDIVKIAGPILALGLGTIDFIKAMISDDADKEMKSAFKKLSTRLIAAVLLFIIPFILAFLMDTFLGNVDGYNSDDPFCGLVEWGEKE